MTSAASLPARTAPSMEPRNFCEVQSPASVKLGIGVRCWGRNLLRPGGAEVTWAVSVLELEGTCRNAEKRGFECGEKGLWEEKGTWDGG
eukprot:1643332-Rhodomonas_salina.4